MSYSVVEIFKTLQGEGHHAGTPAVFLRLAACNMWSGHEEHRERDAVRTGAECPRWCDTDFIARDKKLSPEEVFDRVMAVADGIQFIVITGGEPLLQLEAELVMLLKDEGFYIAVETNGSIDVYDPDLPDLGYQFDIDWVTCSPKGRPEDIKLRGCDELKVVFPSYDPETYEKKVQAEYRYVQPLADTLAIGKSLISTDNTQRAIEFVLAHPDWKLSVQTHKILGLP